MLGSKRIGIITAILVAAALIFTIYMLVNPVESNEAHGEITYENGQVINLSDSDYYSDYTKSSYVKITLDGDYAYAQSGNVDITGGDITVKGGGVYELSGTLNSGSVTVDAPSGGVVKLVLNNAHITSENGSGIYIAQASKTVIALPEGSVSSITDSAQRSDTSIDAALHSEDDLVICGSGELSVNANFADGIKAKDNFKMTGGKLSITSVDEGIKVNDYAALMGGEIKIVSSGDGIKCENSNDSSLGFIVLDAAALNIQTETDAVWAGNDLYVNKTEAVINALDDAVHAEGTLFLNGGTVNIESCTEGLEGKYIVVNDGEYNIVSSDDALNASGEGSTMMPRMGGSNEITAEIYLTVNGGIIRASAGGDSLDSNGAAVINGGYIEVYGPESSGNSTLDFDGGFEINGGTVLAAGASGMAESPSSSSKQNSIVVNLSQAYAKDTDFRLLDENGKTVLEGVSSKSFDWLCVSSDKIKTGSSYTIEVGGNAEADVSVSESVTTSGESSRGGRGGFGGSFGGGARGNNEGGNFQ